MFGEKNGVKNCLKLPENDYVRKTSKVNSSKVEK